MAFDSLDNTAKPIVKNSRSISMVWFIPILALALGAWLVYQNKQDQGPLITISFKTAAGIEAAKTKIKYKDVELGIVEGIELRKDLSGVIVSARMDKETVSFLNENTKFWVVKPRVGAGGISGLGTLLSGAYIGIDASEDGKYARNFLGLEQPPLVTGSTPGIQVKLLAEASDSLVVGSPIYYKSFEVGKIEKVQLSEDFSRVEIEAFIQAPYDNLVNQATNFWNVSGISADISADGISVKMQSLESLIVGGIAFDSPAVADTESFVVDEAEFNLYENVNLVGQKTYAQREFYILNFDHSIRGLKVGAPVDYRGIEVGQVISINTQYDEQAEEVYIPVLIEIEQERVGIQPQLTSVEKDLGKFQELIDSGFRAKLQTGSLITGQLFVAVDFLEDAEPIKARFFNGYPEIPTVSTDLGKITQNMGQILERVNKLEIEKVVENVNQAVTELRKLLGDTDNKIVAVLNSVDHTLADSRKLMRGLDEDSITRYELNTLFKEIQEAARSVRTLVETIEENPNSVIFGKSRQGERQ